MTVRYGATPDEWAHFDLYLGLTDELLPVVSDPKARKSPHSQIKEPGKLPSRFNGNGEMVGFPKWTEYRASDSDIAEWSSDGRLGICVQTRFVRAIDVDIDDFEESFDVEQAITEFFGERFPTRRRPDAEKFLIPLAIAGDLTKRRFKTKNGIIEFLATGQQFIAIGTHPKGQRYTWDGGLPSHIPTVDLAEFEALWAMLVEKFGIEESVTVRKGMTPEKKRLAADIDDPLVQYLVDNWTVHNINKDGRVDFECPHKDGHSTESGPSSTSYYPAGVGGFERGHFKCLHASCAHRTDQDFKNAIGYNSEGFDVIEVPPSPPPAAGESPNGFSEKEIANARRLMADFFDPQRSEKTGRIKVTRETLDEVLTNPVLCGFWIGLDTFREEIMIAWNKDEWVPFKDADYHRICLRLEKAPMRMEHIPVELMRNSITYLADENQFDSAQLWLSKLKWDGKPRVENFLRDYMNADDTPYIRAVSKYMLTGLAGRVLVPGIKADMVPLAIGDQGARKTSAVEALSPSPDFCGELDLSKSDDDLARDIRGKLVVEIGELKGINKRDIEHLKAFISRRQDKWVQKYREYQTAYYRRCIMIGTANGDEPLPPDDTGNRRWLPFNVRPGTKCDVDGIIRDREQLWAEAAVMFVQNDNNVMWRDAERLAAAYLPQYEQDDPWVAKVAEWVFNDQMESDRPADRALHVNEVAAGALGIPARDLSLSMTKRIGQSLRRLGFDKVVRNGVKIWVYKP